ncbi:hypothetical protein GF312_21200 [Candidatus Poribacteria bacterium]|nr:hypothetical protein [Candidatus Poribacteria bacterium]
MYEKMRLWNWLNHEFTKEEIEIMKGFLVSFSLSCLIILFYPQLVRAGAVTNGLLAYWPMDEATIADNIVQDVFGESHGEIKGDPELAPGKIGECLLLDGDADCILINSEVINRDYQQITLECWVFINALDDSWNRILSLDDTDAGNLNVASLYYDDDDDQHGFFLRADGESCAAEDDMIQEDIPLEDWLHLVGTWDGKTVKYYENGVAVKTYSLSSNFVGGNLFFGIGDRADGKNTDTIQGYIDEVRIYEKALTQAEVQQNFQADGLAVTPKDKLGIAWARIKMLN